MLVQKLMAGLYIGKIESTLQIVLYCVSLENMLTKDTAFFNLTFLPLF